MFIFFPYFPIFEEAGILNFCIACYCCDIEGGEEKKNQEKIHTKAFLDYSPGKTPNSCYVLDTFQVIRGLSSTLKCLQIIKWGFLSPLHSCQLAAYGNTFKAKSCFFKARPIKGHKTQHNFTLILWQKFGTNLVMAISGCLWQYRRDGGHISHRREIAFYLHLMDSPGH